MRPINHHKGFAVLITALLLSLAGIAFTTNMAFSQLIDNQITGNYYRNREAFINAESGINLMLSKMAVSTSLLSALPISYHPTDSYFTVYVERINKNRIALNSLGSSQDGTAQREIRLQISYEITYNIPMAAISANGKLNINTNATINDGCEGVSAENCKSPGNLAKYQFVSNPGNETQNTAQCTGALLGQNVIDPSVLHGDNFLIIGEQKSITDDYGDIVLETVSWPENKAAAMQFHSTSVAEALTPSSLFETTFGVTKEDAILALESAPDVARIDMNDGDTTSCSTRLAELDEDINTIYIVGDCDITGDEQLSLDVKNPQRVSIGSVDKPKLLLIKGGHFVSEANTEVVIIGMVYFLPATSEAVDENGDPIVDSKTLLPLLVEDQSIDLGNISVNGAILSEYNCSYNESHSVEPSVNKPSFSVRYDKTVLNKLYQDRESLAVSAGYRIVAGSWRDF